VYNKPNAQPSRTVAALFAPHGKATDSLGARKEVTRVSMKTVDLNRPFEPERYLLNFDTDQLPREDYDAIIIGSGIAGVYTALSMSRSTRILIITKEAIDVNNSVLAQGASRFHSTRRIHRSSITETRPMPARACATSRLSARWSTRRRTTSPSCACMA
jgi:hypothetical protein